MKVKCLECGKETDDEKKHCMLGLFLKIDQENVTDEVVKQEWDNVLIPDRLKSCTRFIDLTENQLKYLQLSRLIISGDPQWSSLKPEHSCNAWINFKPRDTGLCAFVA